MPTRPKANKVAKPIAPRRRGARNTAIYRTLLEQLEQSAQAATDSNDVHHDPQLNASTVSVDGDIGDAEGERQGEVEENIANHLAAANAIVEDGTTASFDPTWDETLAQDTDHTSHSNSTNGVADAEPELDASREIRGFVNGHRYGRGSERLPGLMGTSADVAVESYPNVKIDSALCKRIGNEPAIRVPKQRRTDQKLNIERRSNVEALLAHISGEVPARACKNCYKGHGPWTQCVVYEGQMCGSCTNCWFNASGSRCTFHETNHPEQQPQQPQAGPLLAAIPPHIIAYPDPIPVPPPVESPGVVSRTSNLNRNGNGDRPWSIPWSLADSTRYIIAKAMKDMAPYSKRQRHIARVEAAAKELGMRLAEYDEYLQTPEGRVEQQAAEERLTVKGRRDKKLDKRREKPRMQEKLEEKERELEEEHQYALDVEQQSGLAIEQQDGFDTIQRNGFAMDGQNGFAVQRQDGLPVEP